MRIGFDAKRAFFNNRGLGNYSRDTIRILSNFFPSDEFYLFSPKQKGEIEFSYGTNCKKNYPSGISSIFPSLWRSFGITKQINDLKLDIYHGLSHEIPYGIEHSSARSVVTMHDLIFLQYPEFYPWIDRQLYKKKYLRSCRIADKVIAISQQTKQDLIDFIGIPESKIDVVYQGCNPIFLQTWSNEELNVVRKKYNLPTKYLLNVGAIEPRKNQKLILQALVNGNIDVPLVIVGRSTDYIDELKKYVSENSFINKVIFLTSVPLEDLPAIYQMSSLFIYPSVFEGFGIPIVEAMVSGVPVITSKGSCFEETGGTAAHYIDSGDIENLIFNIKIILNNTLLQKEMVTKGLVHVKRFSDENIARNIMLIYKSIL